MAYTRDLRDHECKRCQKKVTLVRCSNCRGKGSTMTTTCSQCDNSGYVCENQRGDKYHQFGRR